MSIGRRLAVNITADILLELTPFQKLENPGV